MQERRCIYVRRMDFKENKIDNILRRTLNRLFILRIYSVYIRRLYKLLIYCYICFLYKLVMYGDI